MADVSAPMHSTTYVEVARIAKARRDKSLQAFFPVPSINEESLPRNLVDYPIDAKLLSTDEVEITRSTAEDILQKIHHRIWTSVEVTKAFCRAAAVAQALVGLSNSFRSSIDYVGRML